jgi:hypothetical protein
MAARRLIAVMLVLLFLSSLAAALAPVEPQRDETSTSSTTTETAPEPALAGGELVRERLVADPRDPPRIKASVGDQLQLRVTSRRAATLELVGLGPTEDVDPAAPAFFDILLDRKGTFPIKELESGEKVGEIRVSPRARTESDPGQARSRS